MDFAQGVAICLAQKTTLVLNSASRLERVPGIGMRELKKL